MSDENGAGGRAELPEGWEWKKIADVATVVGGSTPKSKEPSYWGGDIPWLGVADLTGYADMYIGGGARSITQAGYDACATQKVPAGTVLFSSRAPIGYVAIAANALCTSQGFKSFVPGESVSSEYLYWWLRYAKPIAESMASGTTFRELSGKRAAEIPVPVPPLEEQDRIVEVVEARAREIAEARLALRESEPLIRTMRAAVLSLTGCTGAETRVGDLLQRVEAGRSFRCHGYPAADDCWGVIKVSAMTWGAFRQDENKEVIDESQVEARWEIKPGDLLLSRANTSDYVGASVLVGGTRSGLLLSDKSLRLVPRTDRVTAEWLHYALSAPAVRAQVSLLATGTSDSMRNLSQDKLNSIVLRVPSLDEQAAVAVNVRRQLASADLLASCLRAQISESMRLDQALGARAFAGALRRLYSVAA